MKREPVQSQALKSVGYEDGVLEVEFHGGAIWQYRDVPLAIWEGFQAAESKGRHFTQHIVPYYASTDMGRVQGSWRLQHR